MKKHVVQVYRLIVLLPCTYLILHDILWLSFDERTAHIMVATNYSILHIPYSIEQSFSASQEIPCIL